MGRWVGCDRRGCDRRGCDVGGCGKWVQVMERGKIESVKRVGVRKKVSSHTHIDMLHLLCTLLTLSSNYCTHER